MDTKGLGPLPRMHEREPKVTQAGIDISGAILDAVKKYELTEAEQLRVVNKVCSEWIGGIAKFAIREERHGNTDKPGGWE